MKLTIHVVGLPIIRERYEVGALAHETHVAHAEGSELAVDAPDALTLLEQAEKFLGRVMASGDDPLELPQAKAWHALHDEQGRKIADLEGSIAGRDESIRRQRAQIDELGEWERRALAALEIVTELQTLVAGSAKPYPRGLRKRITKLRAEY